MQKYINSVADKNGKPFAGASVLVKTYPGGSTATIYADNGSTVQSNPLSTDSNGAFAFYAADGRYSLTISGSGFVTQTIADILLEDPTDGGSPGSFSTLTVAGSATAGASNILTEATGPTSANLAAPGGAALVGFTQGATGSVARTLQAKVREVVVSPEDFGAVGDGTNDDSTALMAMGDYCRLIGSARIKLTPGKTYVYTNPLFLTGVKNSLIIDGWGAAFQNKHASILGPSATFANNEGLVFYPIFFGGGRSAIGTGGTNYFGEAIDTVAAGSTTVTVSGGGSMTNFVVGERVMVYGFSLEIGGFPSNALYFEYATVTGIAGNVLTIDRGLTYDYNTGWPTVLNSGSTFTGAPRVISMRHNSAQEMDYLEINGLRLKADPGWSSGAGGTINRNGRLSVGAYRRCVLNGLKGDGGMYVFQGQSFVDNGSRFEGEVEIDKYIESAVCRAVDYASYAQGTGCRLVRITDGSTIRAISAMDALETFEVESSQIVAAGSGSGVLPGTFGTPNFQLRNTTVNIVSANNKLRSDSRFTAAFTLVSATRIDMANTLYQSSNIFRQLRPGVTLYNAGGQAVFKVTANPIEAAGRVYVDGQFLEGTYTTGDTLYCSMSPYVQASGARYMLNGAKKYLPAVGNPNAEPLFSRRLDDRATETSWWDGGLLQVTTASNFLQLGNLIRATRITISVERVYSGATGTATLRLRRLNGGATNLALIDLKTAGTRVLDASGNYGSVGTDTLTGIGTSAISLVEYFTTPGSPAYASDAEAPIFYIKVDGQRLPE